MDLEGEKKVTDKNHCGERKHLGLETSSLSQRCSKVFLSLPLSFPPSDLHRSKEGDDGEGRQDEVYKWRRWEEEEKKGFRAVCVGGGSQEKRGERKAFSHLLLSTLSHSQQAAAAAAASSFLPPRAGTLCQE